MTNSVAMPNADTSVTAGSSRKGLWAYSAADDKLRDECGVFGVLGHPDAARLTALGLHALQHRGQESAGIVSYDGKRFHSERHLGLVGDRFNKPGVMSRLNGQLAAGHVRYSTTGDTVLRNVQPLFANLGEDGFAVGHNGNLTNAMALRDELVARRRHLPIDDRHRGLAASAWRAPKSGAWSSGWWRRCCRSKAPMPSFA